MDLASLFHHDTEFETLAAGQHLFNQGEKGEVMYILMAGTAEVIIHNKVVETAEAGSILGEMAMVSDGSHSATVIAKSDCKLLPIDRRRFNFLTQETPNFALHVMKVMAERLRKMDVML